MELLESFQKLGIALALGLLVGMQRQRTDSRVAGIRTFPLITLFGAIAAMASPVLGGWLVAAGLVGLTAVLVMANVAKMRVDPDPGLTTEIAAMLMYSVGVYLIVGYTAIAVAVGGAAVLLLHLKQPLHSFVAAMGERDVTAVMQFTLITFVILPVLPDQAFGPYEVLNPHKIWLMVVLIVAISLGGYIAYKLLGPRAGAVLGGILGGLVSSTATTISYARRTRSVDDANASTVTDASPANGVRTGAAEALAVMVIIIASSVSLLRVIVICSLVAPVHAIAIGMPLAVLLIWMSILSAVAYLLARGVDPGEMPKAENPAELKPALLFGLFFALILLIVAFVKHRYGTAGLYPVAIFSGLSDMDAITLSVANLAKDGRIDSSITWRLILMASMSNMVFKGACALVLGSQGLRARVLVFFGLTLAGGAAILIFWA